MKQGLAGSRIHCAMRRARVSWVSPGFSGWVLWLCAFAVLTASPDCLLGEVGSASDSGRAVVMIVHPSFPLDDVRSADLKAMYLGGTPRLAGRTVSLFHLASGHRARGLFEKVILGEEGTHLRQRWIELKLTRSDVVEPRVFKNPGGLVALVAKDASAVAYVPAGVVKGAPVKVLKLDGVPPPRAGAGEAGAYALLLR